MVNFISSDFIDFFYQIDKQKHFSISAFILVFDFLIRYYFIQGKKNFKYALAFALRDTILIGLFKEFIDLLGFGEASLADFMADTIGFLFPIYIYIYNVCGMKKIKKYRIF